MKKKKDLQIWQWVCMLVISIVFIVFAWYFHDKFVHFQSLGLFSIFIINFLASATIFIPAPGIATVIAGGALYPPMLVGIFATVGTVLGDMIGFFLGLSGSNLLVKNNPTIKKLTKLFRRFGGRLIFLFAFIPNPLFDAVGLIAGSLNYSVWKFMIYLFLGRFIRNMLLSFLGIRIEMFLSQ